MNGYMELLNIIIQDLINMTKNQYKFLLILSVAVISIFWLNSNQASQAEIVWLEWKTDFAKTYKTQQEQNYRRQIFQTNFRVVKEHNSKIGKSYTQALTLFADITRDEFQELYLMPADVHIEENQIYLVDQIQNIDWVEKGVVSPVKNTGIMCAATHSWSTLGAIQGIKAIKTGVLTTYSWQQIIDCSRSYGNQGCQGSVKASLRYIKDNGIDTQQEYPTTSTAGVCKNETGSFKIKDFRTYSSCNQTVDALLNSPVSVYVDASNFSFYKSGIFNNCGLNLNLAVVLVGMTNDYWKLKLSWGISWGEKGYIRIAQGNTCGVCLLGASVTI